MVLKMPVYAVEAVCKSPQLSHQKKGLKSQIKSFNQRGSYDSEISQEFGVMLDEEMRLLKERSK